jgi:hypothetical protein
MFDEIRHNRLFYDIINTFLFHDIQFELCKAFNGFEITLQLSAVMTNDFKVDLEPNKSLVDSNRRISLAF